MEIHKSTTQYTIMFTAITAACTYFVVAFVIGWLMLFMHDLLTPGYKTWVEVHRGNVAVGLAVAGQIIGLALVATSAIQHNATLLWAAIWTVIGGALVILGYLLFELATPRLPVGKEL